MSRFGVAQAGNPTARGLRWALAVLWSTTLSDLAAVLPGAIWSAAKLQLLIGFPLVVFLIFVNVTEEEMGREELARKAAARGDRGFFSGLQLPHEVLRTSASGCVQWTRRSAGVWTLTLQSRRSIVTTDIACDAPCDVDEGESVFTLKDSRGRVLAQFAR